MLECLCVCVFMQPLTYIIVLLIFLKFQYKFIIVCDSRRHIQDIHKRMVRFQKLTRNLFLTLHGHNVRRQQRQLSKFLMR
jgi:hypothetical protein